MINKYEYLSNSAFLKKIDRLINKQQIVKIITLDSNEEELQEMQGQIINGSLNLDGKSSVRRTGNLTFLPEDQSKSMEEVKMLISKNKKIKIEIGIKNTTDEYLEHSFIWFPLGLFMITDISFSYGTQGINISLQLKDKMCLLNGDCGGVIPAAVNFSKYDTINDKGDMVTVDVPIYQIIYELVNHFGGEDINKIIIRDIDLMSKRVVKWTGDKPLYVYKPKSSNNPYLYLATNDIDKVNGEYKTYIKGQDIGYEYTEFTYPTSEGLNANAGETVCQILDKIKNTLGNFEYFYDINGNFIFQEIKNYLNTSRSTVELNALNNEDYLVSQNKTTIPYSFDDEMLVSSYSNSPQISLIKNDFVVWGKRKGANDKEIDIRYHLALDKKPEIGNSYKVIYYIDKDGIKKAKVCLEFSNSKELPIPGEVGVVYLVKDIVHVWESDSTFPNFGYYKIIPLKINSTTATDWRTELYLQGTVSNPLATTSNYYYPELYNEWPKLYDVEKGEFIAKNGVDIDYYLDFIDSYAPEIAEISIHNIGRRTEVINNDKINCIFEPDIPNMWIVLDNNEASSDEDDPETLEKKQEAWKRGEDCLFLTYKHSQNILTGGRYNSAYQAIRQALHSYLNYSQTVSISTIPIYHLEPNTVITINNEESSVCGEYVINSMSLPLDISSSMNISCSKVIERI